MTEHRDGGELFSNIAPMLDEITIAFNSYCNDHRQMRNEIGGRNPSGAAELADAAARKAGQIQIMLGHLARVLRRDGHTVSKESVNDSAA